VINDFDRNSKIMQFTKFRDEFESFSTFEELRLFLKEEIKRKKQSPNKIISVPVAKVVRYLEYNFDKDINLAVISNMVSMNYSYFSKIFKNQIGMNYSDYIIKIRMEKAKELLSNSMLKVYEVADKVGYKDIKHFRELFSDYYGISPASYKKTIE
jgi:two-component system response regulator YesN